MIKADAVATIRGLAIRGEGIKSIVRQTGISRNTVRRYLRAPVEPGVQIRPAARRLSPRERERTLQLFRGPAAGNAAAVYRLLATEGVQASVWTVRRTVAPVRCRQDGGPAAALADDFADEMKLVRAIARRHGRTDEDDLEFELTAHLIRLLPRRASARSWRGLLITALSREAKRWLKKRREQLQRHPSFDQSVETEDGIRAWEDRIQRADANPGDRFALDQARRVLPSKLRRVFDVLFLTGGRLIDTAEVLSIHRNTLRPLVAQIRKILADHGFG